MVTVQALDKAQLDRWSSQQVLCIKHALSQTQVRTLQAWTEDLSRWPEEAGKWMKYFERTEHDGRQLCRIENFVPYHKALCELLTGPTTIAVLSKLFGEGAVLFKEKINFKLAGGRGFSAHQDAPAFTQFNQRQHITMMISIDDACVENGCLEFAPTPGTGTLLPVDQALAIRSDIEKELTWTPMPTQAGDIVLFDSFVPHRSRANRTDRPRRALYVTYNRVSDGDVRSAYFEQKRAEFPPEIERAADFIPPACSRFNVGNPIR